MCRPLRLFHHEIRNARPRDGHPLRQTSIGHMVTLRQRPFVSRGGRTIVHSSPSFSIVASIAVISGRRLRKSVPSQQLSDGVLLFEQQSRTTPPAALRTPLRSIAVAKHRAELASRRNPAQRSRAERREHDIVSRAAPVRVVPHAAGRREPPAAFRSSAQSSAAIAQTPSPHDRAPWQTPAEFPDPARSSQNKHSHRISSSPAMVIASYFAAAACAAASGSNPSCRSIPA